MLVLSIDNRLRWDYLLRNVNLYCVILHNYSSVTQIKNQWHGMKIKYVINNFWDALIKISFTNWLVIMCLTFGNVWKVAIWIFIYSPVHNKCSIINFLISLHYDLITERNFFRGINCLEEYLEVKTVTIAQQKKFW